VRVDEIACIATVTEPLEIEDEADISRPEVGQGREASGVGLSARVDESGQGLAVTPGRTNPIKCERAEAEQQNEHKAGGRGLVAEKFVKHDGKG
jgi:hypothetical protein